MTTYHITYKIGETELGKCCFTVAEAFNAIQAIREHDVSLWDCIDMDDMICTLAEMKRGNCTSFEEHRLRVSVVSVRKGGEDNAKGS